MNVRNANYVRRWALARELHARFHGTPAKTMMISDSATAWDLCEVWRDGAEWCARVPDPDGLGFEGRGRDLRRAIRAAIRAKARFSVGILAAYLL